jgi:hypothetical protein
MVGVPAGRSRISVIAIATVLLLVVAIPGGLLRTVNGRAAGVAQGIDVDQLACRCGFRDLLRLYPRRGWVDLAGR